jgi:hypothetical protein
LSTNNERAKIYIIPDNFASGPKIWQGMVSVRNLAEGIVMGLLAAAIVLALPISVSSKITACIIAAGPFVILGAVGINGDPVSVFLLNVYRWLTSRRIMLYNINTKCYSMPILEMMLTLDRPIDAITAFINDIRNRLGLNTVKEEEILIEGRDFVFDRELEDVFAESKRTPTYINNTADTDADSMVEFDD